MSLSTRERKTLMAEVEILLTASMEANFSALIFELMRRHGFAEKSIREAVRKYEEMGKCSIEGDVIVWGGKK